MTPEDIDTLRNTVREALRCSTLGDTSMNVVAAEDLDDLVAIAKEDADGCDMCAQYLDDAGASDLDARKARARVAELEGALAEATNAVAHLNGMVNWRDFGGDDGQGHYEGDYRAAQIHDDVLRWQSLASHDPKEGAA